MGVVHRLIATVAAVALTVMLIAIGFLACLLPPVTHGLSTVYANDPLSPFDRTQLVKVADATRDYAFGAHDKEALYKAIASVDKEYAESVTDKGGKVEKDFPDLKALEMAADTQQYEQAFDGASAVFCYTPDIISHLDDCYNIVSVVCPLLIVLCLLAVGCLVALYLMKQKRLIGSVFMAAGIAVLALFLLLGVWALLDFSGLFATFHELFFAEGNWTFASDSLLICALPTEFWMGMGITWLIVSIIVSIVFIIIGLVIRKRS